MRRAPPTRPAAVRWVALVVLLWSVLALAQDPAAVETPESVATRVAELARDGKAAELAAVAAKDKPDPWDVADVLCDRAAFDVADAFARAAPRAAVEALPEYVASAKQFPKAADGRKRLAEATSLLDAGHAAQALARLDDAAAPTDAELPVVPALRRKRVRGLALSKLARPADALATLRATADDAEKAGWLLLAVRCLIDAAGVTQATGDLAATQAEWARIVTLRERLGDRAGVGRALSNVGTFAGMQGDYRGAMTFLERAALVFEGLGDKPEFRVMAGQVLSNRGLAARWLGRYAEAFVSLSRARDLQRAAGDLSGLATALARLGELHYSTGAFDRAIECESEALRLAVDAGDDIEAAAASGTLGDALRQIGRFDDARAALERARDLYRKIGDAAKAGLADVQLARVARQQGRYALAVQLSTAAEQAIAASPNRRQVVHARLEVGTCRLAASDPAGGLAVFESVASESETLGLRRYVIDAVRGAAAAQFALGRPRDAMNSARRALDVMRLHTGGLSATQLAELRENSSEDFDEVEIGTHAAAALGDAEALSLFLEHGRAADVLASIARNEAERMRDATVRPELRTQEATLREDEAAARHLLTDAIATGDLAAIRERRKAMDKATAAVTAIVERIHVESGIATSVLYPQPAELTRIRGALRHGDALVSFTTAGDETIALVVTVEVARITKFGSTESLRVACAAFDASRLGGASAESVKTLRGRLIDPLALEDDVRRLLVVPDGPLTAVPFALLAPEIEVAYLPSATTLVLLAPQRDVRGREVLAFGDPDLASAPSTAESTRGRAAGDRLAPLPAARDEARAVGDRVLLGVEASEAALLKEMNESASTTPRRRWRAIHFACHGVVDEARPWMSALVLAAGGGHDGRLTALDVVELPLATDLAVLSACETARGRVVRGDGVVGLPRAFLAAGAPRVVVSLWRVDDAATAALMKRFYGLWKDGRSSAAAALRQAQADVRAEKRWEDPAYWAAWQLWGLAD